MDSISSSFHLYHSKGSSPHKHSHEALISPLKDILNNMSLSLIQNNNSEYSEASSLVFEKINQQLEGLLAVNKLTEAAELVMNDECYHDIRVYSFNSLVDKLCNAKQIDLLSSLLVWNIKRRSPLVTKYFLKQYFSLASIQNRLNLGYAILEELTEAATTDENYNKLLFRGYQYYISGCVQCSETRNVLELFSQVKLQYPFDEENSTVYFKIYEVLIKGCLVDDKGLIEKAKFLLEDVAKHLPTDIFFNKLIDFASKQNDIAFGEHIFKVMVSSCVQPSLVTYNTLIDSYFKQKNYEQAWSLFELLKKCNKKPDNFTYSTMINGVKSMDKPDLNRAFQLFNEYKQLNKPDHIIYNCLMDACINAGDVERAHVILNEMKNESSIHIDEISFNTLIKGCCRTRKLPQAIAFFEEMKRMYIKPTRITYNSLIDTCVKTSSMVDAWKFYDDMIRAEIKPDNFTYSILINGIKSNHNNREELGRALNMLDQLQASTEFRPDEIFYNSLIDICVKFNEMNKGLYLFEEMKKKKIEPSSTTYGIIIKAYGKMNDLVRAFKTFEQMKLNHMKITDVTYGCLLDACVKNDRMDLALVLIEKMKQDNVTLNTILYTTLIKGFAKANKLDEALKVFDLMKESPKANPNLITYNCVIDACVRCNNIQKALELFEELRCNGSFRPDMITFSTLMKGFCKQKDVERGLYFLKLMADMHIKPDEAMINILLECCYITGKTHRGMEVLDVMNSLKITPSNITYSILIKLYGKSRKIDKVMEVMGLMRQRNVKPSLITYTNLVQACFKAKKSEYLLAVLQNFENDAIKGDAIFYSKLIYGLIAMGDLNLCSQYLRKAFNERIVLGQEVHYSVLKEFGNSELPEKDEIISMVQKAMKGKSQYGDSALRTGLGTIKQTQNQGFRSTKVEQDSKKLGYKKKEHTVYQDDKENYDSSWNNKKGFKEAARNEYEVQRASDKIIEKGVRQPFGDAKKNCFSGFSRSQMMRPVANESKGSQGDANNSTVKNRYR